MKPTTPRELRRFVAPNEFKGLRQDAGVAHKQVANALGYPVQTVRNRKPRVSESRGRHSKSCGFGTAITSPANLEGLANPGRGAF